MQNAVLIRVTNVYPRNKHGKLYFSGVSVNQFSHGRSSLNDFYNVRTTENDMPIFPVQGQLWKISGATVSMEKKPSQCGKYTHSHYTLSRAQEFKNVLPKSCKSFVEFIGNDKQFKGLGKDKAKDLWEVFGTEIFDILKRKDRQKIATVLTDKATEALIKGFERYGNLRYAAWLTKHDIPLAVQHRIFKFKVPDFNAESDIMGNSYSLNPIDIIKQNPFVLVNLGLTFKQADKIAATHFSCEKTDPRRLVSAMTEALRDQTKRGHTIAPPARLTPKLKALLDNDNSLVELAFKTAHDNSAYILGPSGQYQHKPIYIQENVVAKRLLKLKNKPGVFDDEVNQACSDTFAELFPATLEPLQAEAVLTSVENSVSCITGGPGTGKTFVLNAVISVYKKLGYNIKAIALSGRATTRMRESIKMKTSTIAKFLNEDPIEKCYKYLVVIDESSMIDLHAMYKLFIHTHPDVRFLFCGDPDQLPSIGPGNILKDIITSGVIPNTKLKIVKRQKASTGIPEYAKNIVEGKVPVQLSIDNITFHDTDYDDVAAKCIALYTESPENSRIIAPIKTLVQVVNEGCQQQLNAAGERLIFEDKQGWLNWDATDKLRQNDEVLFTKNNYDADVQNGSLGSLISVEQTSSEYIGEVQLSDNGKTVKLTPTLLQSLQLGYAITLHKAQGSQFPRCIIGLTAGGNVDRAWLYTAITRAEAEIHIVGPSAKLQHAIKNVSNASKRQTNLVNLLQRSKKSLMSEIKRETYDQ